MTSLKAITTLMSKIEKNATRSTGKKYAQSKTSTAKLIEKRSISKKDGIIESTGKKYAQSKPNT